MSKGVRVSTAQNVPLELLSASSGKRVLSFFIDLTCIVLYVYLIIYLEGKFGFIPRYNDLHLEQSSFFQVIVLIFLLPAYTYSLWTEYVFRGQTLGKKILGIRVIKIDGYRMRFSDYFMRWVFRLVDIWVWIFGSIYFFAFFGNEGGAALTVMSFLFTGLVAFVCINRSKNSQRLGDYFAGSTVVKTQSYESIGITILEDIQEDYVATYTEVTKLTDNDARIIKEAFGRAKAQSNYFLMNSLRVRLEEVTGIKNELNDRQYIERIMKDFNYLTKHM